MTDPARSGVDSSPRVGAVLLAAGTGSRYEAGNKLLATVDGTPLVRHAAATLTASAVTDTVVVVGHDAAAVRDALADLPVSFRSNPDYAAGQSTSVRAGIRAARERNWDATVFALGDMPFVDPSSVDALLEQYATANGSIFAAAYGGTRGNPVCFDSAHYGTLADVSGDVGGRQLVEDHPGSRLVATGDPGVTQDIDRVADLPTETE